MGRKSKHLEEEKIAAVKKYEQGISPSRIALEYGVSVRTLRTWVTLYLALGSEAFKEKKCNGSYTKEFKEEVIQAYLSGEGSYRTLSIEYGIGSESVLFNWVRKYNDNIETQDYNPAQGTYMIKSRKTDISERQEIVEYYLNNSKTYTETANHFNVSYTQVYNWVKKYKTLGIDGLEDRRGKNKEVEELSDVEQLENKIKLLEHKLQSKEREVTLLKKVKEIERRRRLIK